MPRTDKKNILILGGARSGKSDFAQKLALELGGKVLFCATAEPLDEEMKIRIEAHRKSRPSCWDTIEITKNLGQELDVLCNTYDVIIIDCITILISNIASQISDDRDFEPGVNLEIDNLIGYMDRRQSHFILVSNEVGMGLVPDNRLGRLYRDSLGKVNQHLAAFADEVYVMFTGIPHKIK